MVDTGGHTLLMTVQVNDLFEGDRHGIVPVHTEKHLISTQKAFSHGVGHQQEP